MMAASKIIAAGLSASLAVAALFPLEARAQYGGNVLGGVLGGVIAGAIVAGSRPQTVYVYPRRRYVRARPRYYATRSKPAATPATAAINTSADPFATPNTAVPITVSNKP